MKRTLTVFLLLFLLKNVSAQSKISNLELTIICRFKQYEYIHIKIIDTLNNKLAVTKQDFYYNKKPTKVLTDTIIYNKKRYAKIHDIISRFDSIEINKINNSDNNIIFHDGGAATTLTYMLNNDTIKLKSTNPAGVLKEEGLLTIINY